MPLSEEIPAPVKATMCLAFFRSAAIAFMLSIILILTGFEDTAARHPLDTFFSSFGILDRTAVDGADFRAVMEEFGAQIFHPRIRDDCHDCLIFLKTRSDF